MQIPEIDRALSACKIHVESSRSQGSEIEQFLTNYILIRVQANFEQVVIRLLTERFQQNIIDDRFANTLVELGVSHIKKGSRTSHLSEMLGRIDPSLKDSFNSKVNGSQKETAYNILVSSRNDAAHRTDTGHRTRTGTDMSLSDLEKYYKYALEVLDDFEDAIKLVPTS